MTDRLLYKDDPAALCYQAYGHAKSWRDGPRGKMKLWHELSTVDRVAWRAAFNAYREETGLGSHVIIPMPPPDCALITVVRDTAYVSHVVPLELLRSGTACGVAMQDAILPGLAESLDKIYADSGRENPEGTPI